MTNITTRSMSNFRDGANLTETVFTQDSVRTKGIRCIADINFDDDSRGSEGQPLVVQSLTMDDGKTHDVVFHSTMGNSVLAHDANTGELLWVERLGTPIPSSVKLDMWYNNSPPYNWGSLSTPVIDTTTNLIHVVCWSDTNGNAATAQYYLHSLSLIDGSQQYDAVNLSVATYQPPNNLPLQKLNTVMRKQRCGLALSTLNGVSTIFVCFGSFNEDADTNQGWTVAVDVTPGNAPRYTAAITTSAKYSGPGVWMAGQAPSITEDGDLLIMTGNGAFYPPTDFGECFLRQKYISPMNDTSMGTFTNYSWFSPFTDTGRVGADPTIASTDLLPGNEDTSNPVGGTSNMNSPDDEDLGSGGPLYVPSSLTGYDKNVMLGAGKDGILYVVDADNMGDTALADFAPTKIASNYAKLLSEPYGFTAYFGQTNLAPTQLDELPTTYGGFTHHQHSTPIYFDSPKYGPMLFTCGENGPLRAFAFNKDYTLTYLGAGIDIASSSLSNSPPGGMPGGMLSLSANGKVAGTGIVWCLMPYGDANKRVTDGRLIVYSADNIVNGIIEKLWDSQDWNIQFKFSKFNVPTPVNGKLYLPTYQAKTMIFE